MEETSYPKMRRPKRQLCFLTSKENPPKQWVEPLTLEDVDGMFDDFDSPPENNVPFPSPLGKTFCPSPNLHKNVISPIPQDGHQMVLDKDALQPVSRSVSYKLDVDLDVPFQFSELVKTSSPVEETTDMSHVEKHCHEKAVPEIVLYLQDELMSEPAPSEKLECTGQVIEERDISKLETPPEKIFIPKLTFNKKEPEASPRQLITECPSVPRKQEHRFPTSDNNSTTVHDRPPVEKTSQIGNSMTAFLQNLKEAGQSKVACPRKSVIPVKVPIPEPKPDFAILEDDATFHFALSSTNIPRKTEKQSRTSGSDKDTSTDKGLDKESRQIIPQDQGNLGKAIVKLGRLAADRKTKAKKKEKEKSDERPGSTKEEMLREQEKPSKSQVKVQSKKNDTAKSQFKDKVSPDTQRANAFQKKTAHRHYETKKTERSKASKDSIKASRTNPSKGTRKKLQSSDENERDVYTKKKVQVDVDPEEVCTPAENDLVESETSGNAISSKEPAGNSSEDGEVLQKRKRKPPGLWWRTDLISQSSEETDNQQPTVKKSKQNSQGPKAVKRSPVKHKKDKVFKKRTQKETALSSPRGNKAKEKEMKQNKKRNKSENTPQAKEEIGRTLKTADEPQSGEVHEVDQGEEESTPSVFDYTDQTIRSGPLFQKAYHHTTFDNISTTPAAADSEREAEQSVKEAEPTKRRRKQTGSWWIVSNNNNNMADNVETVVPPRKQQPTLKKSKPQKREHPQQDRTTGLCNQSPVDVLYQPAGGAPVTHLKLRPLFTPKSVRSSVAKFTDIFTKGVETPTGVGVRDAQKNRRNVASHPAKEKETFDCLTPSTCPTVSPVVDGGEDVDTPNSLKIQPTPQDDKRDTESKSHCFRSGPCSLIELDECEEEDSLSLPTSKVQALLSPCDLCSLPLKPLVLQPKDKVNLAEWFKSLWFTTAKNVAVITPDQFEWFYYRDKAMGLHVETNAGPICYGKMMLGSHMKKPLWVDHSATTVFHLLTSTVSVTINGTESYFSPGQSFMVNCGHAYSIHNVTSLPAMLYFTRMAADSSD